MVLPAARWLAASLTDERLTQGFMLRHVRELMALRKIQAREQDSWAQVSPPTVQLLNLQLCSAARLKEAA